MLSIACFGSCFTRRTPRRQRGLRFCSWPFLPMTQTRNFLRQSEALAVQRADFAFVLTQLLVEASASP